MLKELAVTFYWLLRFGIDVVNAAHRGYVTQYVALGIVAVLIMYGISWYIRKVERSNRSSLGPMHDAIIGKRLRTIGFALIVASLAIMAATFLIIFALEVRNQYSILVLVFCQTLLPIALIFIGIFLLYRGRQYLARVDSAERLLDPRPPVVLLRPFQSDASGEDVISHGGVFAGDPAWYIYTFEEHLAAALRPIGPLVALGQPEEALAPVGASRLYETNETWKDSVVDLFRKARIVVLIFDTSSSVLWETVTALRMLKPRQLLILGVGRDTPREYEALSRMFKETTGRELPDLGSFGPAIKRQILEERSGIIFGEDWTPRILRLRAPFWRAFAGSWTGAHVHYGLEPVFRANGIAWRPFPVSALEVLCWLFFVIFVIGCLIALGGDLQHPRRNRQHLS
jgi:hypothetical protein